MSGHLNHKCLDKHKSNNRYKYTVDVEASKVHEICLQLPQDTNHVQLCVQIISKLKEVLKWSKMHNQEMSEHKCFHILDTSL